MTMAKLKRNGMVSRLASFKKILLNRQKAEMKEDFI